MKLTEWLFGKKVADIAYAEKKPLPVKESSSAPAPVIGQPVLAIIEATKDVKRWEKGQFGNIEGSCLHLVDTKTGVEYEISRSTTMIAKYHLMGFSWMTEDESSALQHALWKLGVSIAKAENEQQRAKMMEVYCKEV